MDNYKDEYEEPDDSKGVRLELSAESARSVLREINELVHGIDPRSLQGSGLQSLRLQVARGLQAVRTPMNLSDNELQVLKSWGFTHKSRGDHWGDDDQRLARRLGTELRRRTVR